MRESLRYLRIGNYAKRQEYTKVADILYSELFRKVRNLMSEDERVKEISTEIEENNETFFDKEREWAFQSNYGPKSGSDEIYADWRFNPERYNTYIRYTCHFDDVLSEILSKKDRLQKGFHFHKKAKLVEVDNELEHVYKSQEYWLKVREKEETFKKIWQKDGEFYDINKDKIQELIQISIPYIEKTVKECLDNHPEFMLYEFDTFDIDSVRHFLPISSKSDNKDMFDTYSQTLTEIVKNEQDSRVLVAEHKNQISEYKQEEMSR